MDSGDKNRTLRLAATLTANSATYCHVGARAQETGEPWPQALTHCLRLQEGRSLVCVFVFKGSFVSQGAHLGALRSCFQHLAPGCAGRKPAPRVPYYVQI